MRILVTNDDGINAQGIHALIKELSNIAEIYLVAPDRERSGTGHSITVFDPIRVVETNSPGVKQGWIVGGTPVDCVKLAMARLIDSQIDLVVSGINHGPNLGTDVLYSGTVSAAAEGVLMGCPALAVSLDTYKDKQNFDFTAQFTRRIAKILVQEGIDRNTLVNINVPDLSAADIKGVKITQLGVRNYNNLFEERKDPRGNTYYWLGGGVLKEEQHGESDVHAVQQGFISVTPIKLDLTDYQLIRKYRNLSADFLNSLMRDK